MNNRRTQFAITVTALCVVSLAGMGFFSRAQAAAKSPMGTWKLNLQKSSFGSLAVPKFEQLVISSETVDSVQWNLKGIGPDGKSYISSYDGPIDGKDHPMHSSGGSTTVAYTRTVTGVSWVVKSKDGTVVETASSQLSPDGNTLTITGTTHSVKGPAKFISVFNRTQ